MARSNKPIVWGPFAAGGTLTAFVTPALIALTLAAALGFPPALFSYAGASALSDQRALVALRGDTASADAQVQRAIEHKRAFGHYHHAQYDIACTYAFLGETELAMQWLRDSAYNGFPCPTFFQRDPFLLSVRGTAFDELIAELNVIREEHRQLYATLIGTTSAA